MTAFLVRSFLSPCYKSRPSVSSILFKQVVRFRLPANMAIRPFSDEAVEKAASSIHQPRDPNTLSNYNAWRTKHTKADFEIDFERKRLKGIVELTLERLAREERKIVLDTRYARSPTATQCSSVEPLDSVLLTVD